MNYSYNDFFETIFSSFEIYCYDKNTNAENIVDNSLIKNFDAFVSLLQSNDEISKSECQCVVQLHMFSMINAIQNQKEFEVKIRNFILLYYRKIENKIKRTSYIDKSSKDLLFDKLFYVFSIILKNVAVYFAFIKNLTTASVDRILEQDEAVKEIQSSLNIANENIAELNETVKKFDDIDEKIEETNKKFSDTIRKTNNKIRGAKKNIDNIIPHMLTSLGIFVSIIIAVVVIYLSDLISIDGNVPTYITQFQFARYLMSGHIIFNIVFLMLYLISRLTNKTVLLRCSEYVPLVKYEKFKYRPCANCEKQSCGKCNFIKKLWKKATYMVGINLICFAGYLFLYDWWIIENYLWDTLNNVINNGGYLLTTEFIRGSIYLLLVNLLFVGLYFLVRHKYIKKSSNKSKKKSN